MSSFFYVSRSLSGEQFKGIFSSYTDSERKDIICDCLSESIIIYNGGVYNFRPDGSYYLKVSRLDEYPVVKQIGYIVSEFLSWSLRIISETSTSEFESFQKLINEYSDEYEKAAGGKYLKNVDQYVMKLTHVGTFDTDLKGIQFLNGRYDLVTGEFKENSRKKEDYICTILPYEYIIPTTANEGKLTRDVQAIDFYMSQTLRKVRYI